MLNRKQKMGHANDKKRNKFTKIVNSKQHSDFPVVSVMQPKSVAVPTLTLYPNPFQLSSLNGTNGFQLDGYYTGASSGYSVSAVGDINGDGYDDIIIGSPLADPGPFHSGETYVVFGKSVFTTPLELSSLNGDNGGFQIIGIAASDESGWSVSGAGDVNGDGYHDLIIGARYASPSGRTIAGQSYVIFGNSTFPNYPLALSDLNGENGFQINGIVTYDNSGYSVSGVGDINRDGYDDVIIGAPFAASAGQSYVVFGQSIFISPFELSSLNGENGFQINGITAGGRSGNSVSGVGDVNGDGFADVIIGAPYAAPGDRAKAGQSYVVFGQSIFISPFELSSLNGENGFQINGITASDRSGNSVSGAGDVNGDGFADVIIGAPEAAPNNREQAGQSYVVFGKTNFTTLLELSSLNGSDGFQINGITAGDRSGNSVSGVGDVNRDGYDDFIIGASRASPNGYSQQGQSYLIFGRSSFTSRFPFELSSLNGGNGFAINGIATGDESGSSVSGAGDVNGDGYLDLIIGASGSSPNGYLGAGESYVLYGSIGSTASPPLFRGNMDLANFPSSDGFIIKGASTGDYAGTSVSGTGDINEDGIPDLLIGAPWANSDVAGGAYVVYGGQNGTVNLATLSSAQGLIIEGAVPNDLTGTSVSGTGDVNGDDIPDLLIGTPGASSNAGMAYVIYGGQKSTINLSNLPNSQGFIILGQGINSVGISVSGTGDVNGDSIPDLLIGASNTLNSSYLVYGGLNGTIDLTTFPNSQGFIMQRNAATYSDKCSVSGAGDIDGDGIPDLLLGLPYDFSSDPGTAYLVYGGQKGKINLSSFPSSQGFTINGPAINSHAGYSVSGTGDINEDGFPDLLIGTPSVNYAVGAAYLVYGGQDGMINLASFPNSQGFVIKGVDTSNLLGASVSGAGDINGDGIPDLLVGAPGINSAAGGTYVIYGGQSGVIDLATFPSIQGFLIWGVDPADQAGASVSGIGDVNQDGIPDMLVGAPGANRNAGAAYVVYGQKQAATELESQNSYENDSLSVVSSAVKQFSHFYQQGKEYLASFWNGTTKKTIESELSAKEQARLRALFKMQITVEKLADGLTSTHENEEFLKKALSFYFKKIIHWQEIVRELSAQDIRDLQGDIMKLKWKFYSLDDMISTTQFSTRDEIGFFRTVNISSGMEQMMLAAQANYMLP